MSPEFGTEHRLRLLEAVAVGALKQLPKGHSQGPCAHGQCPLCGALEDLKASGWTPGERAEPEAPEPARVHPHDGAGILEPKAEGRDETDNPDGYDDR